MAKKSYIFLILLLPFLGCKDVETKKVSSETFLAEELKEVDFKSVDMYPSFAICDSLKEKTTQRACFELQLCQNFYAFLATKTLIFEVPVHDTVWLDLSISAQGTPALVKIAIPDSLYQQVPQMDMWLHQSLDSLPKIYPAIKRGIPVKTAFRMPIVIEVD